MKPRTPKRAAAASALERVTGDLIHVTSGFNDSPTSPNLKSGSTGRARRHGKGPKTPPRASSAAASGKAGFNRRQSRPKVRGRKRLKATINRTLAVSRDLVGENVAEANSQRKRRKAYAFVSREDEHFVYKRAEALARAVAGHLRLFTLAEWAYGAIDRGYFLRNEFGQCLAQINLPNPPPLTRTEWSALRLDIGRPRRLSESFLRAEREKLERYRSDVRRVQAGKLPSASLNDGPFVYQVPKGLSVGDDVSVIHPVQRMLSIGRLLTTQVKKGTCMVQFARDHLGTQKCRDVDTLPHGVVPLLYPALRMKPTPESETGDSGGSEEHSDATATVEAFTPLDSWVVGRSLSTLLASSKPLTNGDAQQLGSSSLPGDASKGVAAVNSSTAEGGSLGTLVGLEEARSSGSGSSGGGGGSGVGAGGGRADDDVKEEGGETSHPGGLSLASRSADLQALVHHMSIAKRLLSARRQVVSRLLRELNMPGNDSPMPPGSPPPAPVRVRRDSFDTGGDLRVNGLEDEEGSESGQSRRTIILLATWNAELSRALEPELTAMRRIWARIASAAKAGADRALKERDAFRLPFPSSSQPSAASTSHAVVEPSSKRLSGLSSMSSTQTATPTLQSSTPAVTLSGTVKLKKEELSSLTHAAIASAMGAAAAQQAGSSEEPLPIPKTSEEVSAWVDSALSPLLSHAIPSLASDKPLPAAAAQSESSKAKISAALGVALTLQRLMEAAAGTLEEAASQTASDTVGTTVTSFPWRSLWAAMRRWLPSLTPVHPENRDVWTELNRYLEDLEKTLDLVLNESEKGEAAMAREAQG